MTGYLNPYNKYEDINTRRCQLLYLFHCQKETVEKISKLVGYACSTVRIYARKFYDMLGEAVRMFTPNKGKVYFVKFYNAKGELVYIKIGKTIRTVNKRMKELLDSYWSDGVRSVEVVRVVECRYFSEEGLERFVQSLIIRDYPNSHIPNDRFSVDISGEVFDKYVQMYLG